MPFLAFFLSPIGKWIAIAAVAAVAIGGSFLYVKTHYYNQGYAAAIADIAAQDQRAIDAKDKAIAKSRACRDAGRTWDVSLGVCE